MSRYLTREQESIIGDALLEALAALENPGARGSAETSIGWALDALATQAASDEVRAQQERQS